MKVIKFILSALLIIGSTIIFVCLSAACTLTPIVLSAGGYLPDNLWMIIPIFAWWLFAGFGLGFLIIWWMEISTNFIDNL